ncbi:hypothetical protein EDC04DRAFT_2716371, partial [Pisolithus marmoratus]
MDTLFTVQISLSVSLNTKSTFSTRRISTSEMVSNFQRLEQTTVPSLSVQSLYTSSTPSIAVGTATTTSMLVYSTGLSTTSTPDGKNASSAVTSALVSHTTSQRNNASTSPSSSQIPPTASSSTSSHSAVVIGSSIVAAVLLLSIAIITLLCRLRSRRRNLDAHARPEPFEYTRPTVSPVNRKDKSGIWCGQRGYDHERNRTPSRSDSVTVVGTGDLRSLSEIADSPGGLRTLIGTCSPSVIDIRPGEDHSVIARCERLRELDKLYPTQPSGAKRTRIREQEGHENHGSAMDDGRTDGCEPCPNPHRRLRAESASSILSTTSRFITLYLPGGWSFDSGKEVLTQVKMRTGVVVKGQASPLIGLSVQRVLRTPACTLADSWNSYTITSTLPSHEMIHS